MFVFCVIKLLLRLQHACRRNSHGPVLVLNSFEVQLQPTLSGYFEATVFHVLSARISSQPPRSCLSSTVYNRCLPSSIFAPLCPSSVSHSSPHIHSKTCTLAHPFVAGLEMRSGARLLNRIGKLIRTREFGQTPSL